MTIEEVISTAIRLLSKGGQPVWVVVVVALLAAVLITIGHRINLPGDPTPHDSQDDSAPSTDKPPAEWAPNDGPPGGGMEGG